MKWIARHNNNTHFIEDNGNIICIYETQAANLFEINDNVAIDKNLRDKITVKFNNTILNGEVIYENEIQILINFNKAFITCIEKNDEIFKTRYKRTYTKSNIRYIKDETDS